MTTQGTLYGIFGCIAVLSFIGVLCMAVGHVEESSWEYVECIPTKVEYIPSAWGSRAKTIIYARDGRVIPITGHIRVAIDKPQRFRRRRD